MKSIKLLFLPFLAVCFALAGCNLNLGFLKVEEPQKEEKKDSDEKPQDESSSQSGDQSGSGSESSATVTLQDLKNLIAPIAADFYEYESASQVEFSDWEGEEYTDAYYHESSDLLLVTMWDYDLERDAEEAVNYLLSFLPAERIADEDNYSEEGYFDYIFICGLYGYYMSTEDFGDEEGPLTEIYFAIFPSAQKAAFIDYFFE